MTKKKTPKKAAPTTQRKEAPHSSLLCSSKLPWLARLLIALVVVAAIWFFVARRRGNDTAPIQYATKINATYVDNQICAECHQKEFQDWTGSDHQMAMALPNDETVRADFNNTQFKKYGVTSRFFKKNGKFFVNTETGDGSLADFEIKYT